MYESNLRRIFEDHCKPTASPRERMQGAGNYITAFRKLLGLETNAAGRPVRTGKAKKDYRLFSLKGLAESLVGPDWAEQLTSAGAQDFRVFEAGNGAGAVSMTPSNFPNVSAFLGSVTGLLDAAVLERYDKPEYIIDKLVDVIPSKTRQKRMLGVGRIGDQAQRRNPGEPHQFVQFQERYTVTPQTEQDAMAMGVTFEAVFFDQTGEILDQANGLGDELGLRKELDGFRVIAGVTNPYNYRGTSYSTYLTTGNWINDLPGNPLYDWTDVNEVNALFKRMTDQETGNRIAIDWDTMLVSPTKEMSARYIENATEIETRTQSGTEIRRGSRLGERYEILSSVYLDHILTTASGSGGLNLSQSDADDYWWALKTGKGGAFYRVENWPVRVNRAAPNDFDMLNHQLMLAIFTNQMHAYGVFDPRFVIRSRG